MKKAKEAQDMRDSERKAKERAEDAIITSDVLSELIWRLDVGETAMEALVRYGKAAPKPKKATTSYNKKKKSSTKMDVDTPAFESSTTTPTEDSAASKAKEAITSITECASRLSDRGVDDVYELSREQLMRQYKRDTGEEWKNPHPESIMWEFHWLAAAEGDINGPYDQATMRAWQSAGQFEAGAEFRKVGEEEWSRLLDFDDD